MENTNKVIEYCQLEDSIGYNRHFFNESINLEYENPSRFVCSIWSKKRRVHPVFLLYRIFLGLWSIAALIWAGIFFWRNGLYFVFLTNWSYISLSCYLNLSAIMSLKQFIQERSQKEICINCVYRGKMPTTFKIIWVFFNLGIVSLLITFTFWIFVYFNMDSSLRDPFELDCVFHILNAVMIIMDIIITSIPLRLYHVIQAVLFYLAYILFTYLFIIFGGKKGRPDRFIYIFMDWLNDPVQAIVVAAGGAFWLIFVFVLCLLLSWAMSWIVETLRGSDYKFCHKINNVD